MVLEIRSSEDVLCAAIPHIKTLKLRKISIVRYMSDVLATHLGSLISRSGCTLDSLRLPFPNPRSQTIDVLRGGFSSLIRQLSAVENFIITGASLDNEDTRGAEDDLNHLFLRTLLPTHGSPLLLPKLRRLKIVTLKFDPSLLAHVLQRRLEQTKQSLNTACAPIGLVEIDYFRRSQRSSEQRRLGRYYQEALDVISSSSEAQCQSVVLQGTCLDLTSCLCMS